jgi:asparagine synthase (glutamine-hydrolysing)
MCGFVGYFNLNGKRANQQEIGSMLDTITHRGPDDHDMLVHESVGLGHRRLSILDLSENGRQPMPNHDRSMYIVYNGEIYNFRKLRAELGESPPLRSETDTEVLLRAYERWGIECLDRLIGMFAFGILDIPKRKLFLARDRFGIKPLYYCQNHDRFLFASEIKPLFKGGQKAILSHLHVLDWISSGETADNDVLFAGIHRLPQGSYAVLDLDDHSFEIHKYYRAEPAWDRVPKMPGARKQLVDMVDAELCRSVEAMMVADVPVGTYCSGGIDSSLITAIAARQHPDIHAFNVAIPTAPKIDDGPYAEVAARHLKVKLFTTTLDAPRFRDNLVRAIYHLDGPLTLSNTVPLMLVSELARENGVKVILSGEGADEIFGGYVGFFRRLAYEMSLQAKGRFVESLFRRAEALLSRGFYHFRDANRPWFLPRPLAHVLCGGLRYQPIVREAREIFASDRADQGTLQREIASQLYTQLGTYLLPILQRTDVASMAASIEARVPFLDRHVVELALAIPVSEKVHCTPFSLKPKGKYILKRVAERYLPDSIVHKPKLSFDIPAHFYDIAWPKAWKADGFLVRSFNLNADEFSAWLISADMHNRFRALNLEIWGQLFHYDRPRQEVEVELQAAKTDSSTLRVPELKWQSI